MLTISRVGLCVRKCLIGHRRASGVSRLPFNQNASAALGLGFLYKAIPLEPPKCGCFFWGYFPNISGKFLYHLNLWGSSWAIQNAATELNANRPAWRARCLGVVIAPHLPRLAYTSRTLRGGRGWI